MPLVNGYCTPDELRAYLADGAQKLDQTLLENAIGAASRAIDSYCGRRFWQDDAVSTRVYARMLGDIVLVDDISTRTGLVVTSSPDGLDFSTTLTDDVDFVLEPRNADQYATLNFGAYAFDRIRLTSATGRQFAMSTYPALSVTARFGWAATPVEIHQACLLKAAALFKRKEAPFGVAGFNEFGVVRIRPNDPDVEALLEPYRFVRVA